MARRTKVILGICGIVSGWFLTGWAYTTKLGHPISTICFLLGIALFFGSFYLFKK